MCKRLKITSLKSRDAAQVLNFLQYKVNFKHFHSAYTHWLTQSLKQSKMNHDTRYGNRHKFAVVGGVQIKYEQIVQIAQCTPWVSNFFSTFKILKWNSYCPVHARDKNVKNLSNAKTIQNSHSNVHERVLNAYLSSEIHASKQLIQMCSLCSHTLCVCVAHLKMKM